MPTAVDANSSARLREYMNLTKDNASNVPSTATTGAVDSNDGSNVSSKLQTACDKPRLDDVASDADRGLRVEGDVTTLKATDTTPSSPTQPASGTLDSTDANASSPSTGNDNANASKSPPPPPIVTFEEWTKERLSHKDRRPPAALQDTTLPVAEGIATTVEGADAAMNAEASSERVDCSCKI